MVTASHNPKDDNGYKVYWDNGAQIVEPHDKGISEAIEANLQPWGVDPQSVKSNPLVEDPSDSVFDAYFKRIQEWSFHSKDNASRDLKIVYTAMHGVGKECATRAFSTFNLKPFYPVAQQIDPHPDFPTVPFPNPEEGKGALVRGQSDFQQHENALLTSNLLSWLRNLLWSSETRRMLQSSLPTTLTLIALLPLSVNLMASGAFSMEMSWVS
jgi:phosphomannomutase